MEITREQIVAELHRRNYFRKPGKPAGLSKTTIAGIAMGILALLISLGKK